MHDILRREAGLHEHSDDGEDGESAHHDQRVPAGYAFKIAHSSGPSEAPFSGRIRILSQPTRLATNARPEIEHEQKHLGEIVHTRDNKNGAEDACAKHGEGLLKLEVEQRQDKAASSQQAESEPPMLGHAVLMHDDEDDDSEHEASEEASEEVANEEDEHAKQAAHNARRHGHPNVASRRQEPFVYANQVREEAAEDKSGKEEGGFEIPVAWEKRTRIRERNSVKGHTTLK